MKADTVIENHFYANINNVRYYDGFMFGLNEQTSTFYEYNKGLTQDTPMGLKTWYYTIFLAQGTKQTETVYKITPYSSFVGNFAALTLTEYSVMGFILSLFQG